LVAAPRNIHEDVESAGSLSNLPKRLRDGEVVGVIACDPRDLSTKIRMRDASPSRKDSRTCTSKSEGGAATHPAARTRNEGYLSVELRHGFSGVGLFEMRRRNSAGRYVPFARERFGQLTDSLPADDHHVSFRAVIQANHFD
jgi:hypothetical protein